MPPTSACLVVRDEMMLIIVDFEFPLPEDESTRIEQTLGVIDPNRSELERLFGSLEHHHTVASPFAATPVICCCCHKSPYEHGLEGYVPPPSNQSPALMPFFMFSHELYICVVSQHCSCSPARMPLVQEPLDFRLIFFNPTQSSEQYQCDCCNETMV